VRVDEVAGWGVDTVAGIDFYTASWLDMLLATPQRAYRPVLTEDGDGTVAVPSALQIASSTSVKRYWVDLAKVNNLPGTKDKYTHANIFELVSVQNFVKNLIENSTNALPSYIQDTQPSPNESPKQLVFFLHSPLTLQLADASGNVTGVAPDGTVTQDIPGSTYDQFGEVKYVIVPEGAPYTLTLRGQASGTFSLDMQEMQGGTVTASSTIAGVPTTASTTAQMTIGTSFSALSPLTIDEDGDGTIDATVTPALGRTTVFRGMSPGLCHAFGPEVPPGLGRASGWVHALKGSPPALAEPCAGGRGDRPDDRSNQDTHEDSANAARDSHPRSIVPYTIGMKQGKDDYRLPHKK
jgi:hypothetical protein